MQASQAQEAMTSKICNLLGSAAWKKEILEAVMHPPKPGQYRKIVLGLASPIMRGAIEEHIKQTLMYARNQAARKLLIDVLVFFEYEHAHGQAVATQLFEALGQVNKVHEAAPQSDLPPDVLGLGKG